MKVAAALCEENRTLSLRIQKQETSFLLYLPVFNNQCSVLSDAVLIEHVFRARDMQEMGNTFFSKCFSFYL